MSQQLEGKVAVVTGASKGIGAAIARQLADAGASVVVNYSSSREGADRVVGEITRNGGQAVAVQADLSTEDGVRQLFSETGKAYGKLDILVNNAGLYEFAPLSDVTVDHFRKQFDLNVLGLLLASREAARFFGPEGGSIINVSSVVSEAAFPNTAVYSATKAAVDSITRTLAAELGPRKIRVNAINPGMVETEGFHAAGIAEGDMPAAVKAQTPLGRLGQPDDIAPAVVFLASEASGWVSGETVRISGGFRG
jgi:3-oxoacyl-[acyl-carrier protein] reductase